MLQKLSVIGEAAARLSEDFRAKKADVPWREIIAFRNIAVHAYFAVDWQMVWRTATEDAPALRAAIAELLKQDFPETFSRLPHALTALRSVSPPTLVSMQLVTSEIYQARTL